MVLVALTATCSASYGDEPMPDHEYSRIPVAERPRPEFDPLGYRLGSVFFYPKLTAGLNFDSNVYATETNTQSDWYALISPELTITYGTAPSGYQPNPSRFSYEINLKADIYRFRELGTEDREDARARLKTHWEIAQDLHLEATLEAARKHEERGDSSSPRNAAEPVPYNDLRGEATLTKTLGRFGVAVNGAVRNLTYEDVESFDGIVLDQSDRDGTIYSTYIKPFYEFSPGYRVFVRAGANSRDYEGLDQRNRDSSGYDVRAGVDFLLTPLIYGSVEAGYMSQSYDNSLIAPIDGLSFKGELTWLATTLMTFKAMAERKIAETITPGFEARVDTSFGAEIDYELLRNVILFSAAKFTEEDFRGSQRKDDVTKVSGGVKYLMNRHAQAGIRYDYVSRDSTLPVFSFDKHVVMFNVTTQY